VESTIQLKTLKPRQHNKGLARKQRQRRGQVMVLGCVTMLLLATTLMMSFSIANVVHERIRIQSHADAMAFSMAVVEARAMNYLAYSNRAIAAAFVSMTSVHAYMAIASSSMPWLWGGAIAMFTSAALEFAACPPFQWQHCLHGIRVLIRAIKYIMAVNKYSKKINNMEDPFNKAVEAFTQLADDLHASQRKAVTEAKNTIRYGKELKKLEDTNAECATSIHDGVGKINEAEFACALEGSPLGEPSGGIRNCPSKSAIDNRREIMSNVVNAARPPFLRMTHLFIINMGTQIPLFFHEEYLKDLLGENIPDPDGIGIGIPYTVYGQLTDNFCSAAKKDSKGKFSCARAGMGVVLFTQVIDMPGIGVALGVTSAGSSKSPSGNNHTWGHKGEKHDKYKGLFADDKDDCTSTGNCFINYRLSDKERGWGQPAVYSYVTQELAMTTDQKNKCNKAKRPWEINSKSEITLNHGQRPQGKLKFSPNREGAALSKALVYFHRMENWKFAPNLFDPYWRAKLHPFSQNEMKDVLKKAGSSGGLGALGSLAGIGGNTDADLPGMGVPAEGKFGLTKEQEK